MSRLVPILCVACAAGIGLTAWSQLSAGDTHVAIPKIVPGVGDNQPTEGQPTNPPPDGTKPAGQPLGKTAEATHSPTTDEDLLRQARKKCSVAALDVIVKKLKDQTSESKDAKCWHRLAEAYLERAQQRTHLLGMTPGKPTYAELPDDFADDLELGLAAVLKARELGDESGELYRIEAGLMGQHITGLGSALQWNGKIAKALKIAGERRSDDPHLHTALGLRKLLAPTWFGHDPAKALEHFEFAHKTTDDERPAVFAAMASYLQKKRQQAIAWLERAVKKNPDNKFARVVLERLRRGEENPFARDVTEAEVNASK